MFQINVHYVQRTTLLSSRKSSATPATDKEDERGGGRGRLDEHTLPHLRVWAAALHCHLQVWTNVVEVSGKAIPR